MKNLHLTEIHGGKQNFLRVFMSKSVNWFSSKSLLSETGSEDAQFQGHTRSSFGYSYWLGIGRTFYCVERQIHSHKVSVRTLGELWYGR